MNRIHEIQAALPGAGLDAIFLHSPVNRQYATGFASSDGAVVITRHEAFFFTDSRYIEAARKAVTGATVGEVTMEMRIPDWVCSVVADCGIQVMGFEEESMSHSMYLRYAQEFPVTLQPAQGILKTLRAAKTPEELAYMVQAQRIAERALEDVLGLIRPGLTEWEVAAELTYRMLKYGGERNSFDPIVVTGAKSSMPHGVPGDRVIQKGDFVTMDFGTVKNGYCSDMTRTVAVGSADEEMRKVYAVVLSAQQAGIERAQYGVPGCEIDAAARRVIEQAGYGAYFGHSFGHSLGLEIHEGPNAAPSERRQMPKGAVISAEPGIYLPGKFGVRIEDVLYLGEAGTENLTRAPKELIIL
jgi:Xaa-Pro aminopeptidase